MLSIDVRIALSAEACHLHYVGQARRVRARSLDGRWVEFPATALRQVVTRDGVHGVFRLHFSAAGRLQRLEPLAPSGRRGH